MKYVDVVVDNNTDATDLIYTYQCEDDSVFPGERVRVPFSVHNKVIDAFVVRVYDEKPQNIKRFKKVLELDPETALSEEALKTALWMRGRYICRYIEAIKCFLPSGEAKRKTKDPFENIVLNEDDAEPKELNKDQREVFEKLRDAAGSGEYKAFMLLGVTGSGKTEIYLQLMQEVLKAGRQGIVLVPEISLTPQLVSRFISRFGREAVAILHSRLTRAQKSVEYKRISKGEAKLVIGARSAIFAPFKSIGLIILDEEHESSYKSDKSPKYDTVEVAVKRAMASKAVLLFGSATPSVSNYHRSENGIFELLELPSRYNDTPMPEVRIVDMTKEVKAGNRSLFSRSLSQEIKRCLEDKKQIILFLNRRGYYGYVSCRECGFVVKCSECGIAMPYHKDVNACVCHYCGRKEPFPRLCPDCGSRIIGRFGAGTQQVEERVKELFPGAAAERLDLDSIRKKGELESILSRFGKGKTDILIGTQLVAKGLDFENVGLVGVVSADVTLNIPDFRSAERTFQLVTQAAGRSGRGSERGKVIVQTYNPESYALIFAARHDYKGFYEREIAIRRAVLYPPYSDIFQLLIQSESRQSAEEQSARHAEHLRKNLPEGTYVLGPAASTLQKQGGMFRYQILIKSPAGRRRETSEAIVRLKKSHEKDRKTDTLLTVDINPFSYI